MARIKDKKKVLYILKRRLGMRRMSLNRYRPGTTTRSLTRPYPHSSNQDTVFSRSRFRRFVDGIMESVSNDIRITDTAMIPLQEAAEMYVSEIMRDSKFTATWSGRNVVSKRDLKLAQRIRGYK